MCEGQHYQQQRRTLTPVEKWFVWVTTTKSVIFILYEEGTRMRWGVEDSRSAVNTRYDLFWQGTAHAMHVLQGGVPQGMHQARSRKLRA